MLKGNNFTLLNFYPFGNVLNFSKIKTNPVLESSSDSEVYKKT